MKFIFSQPKLGLVCNYISKELWEGLVNKSSLERTEQSLGFFFRFFSVSTANATYLPSFDSEILACPRADFRCTGCKLLGNCKESVQTSCN